MSTVKCISVWTWQKDMHNDKRYHVQQRAMLTPKHMC